MFITINRIPDVVYLLLLKFRGLPHLVQREQARVLKEPHTDAEREKLSQSHSPQNSNKKNWPLNMLHHHL